MSNLYSLHKTGRAWDLTFGGRRAYIQDQRGLHYVVWLLTHPHGRPVHAVELVQRALGNQDHTLQQRSAGLDEIARIRRLRQHEKHLEAMLEDACGLNPSERGEAESELAALRTNRERGRWLDQAAKCTRAVHKSMYRLYDCLANGVDVPAAFGEHLWQYLLVPSGRSRIRGRRAGLWPGCYVYEPPEGVCWDCGVGGGVRLRSKTCASGENQARARMAPEIIEATSSSNSP